MKKLEMKAIVLEQYGGPELLKYLNIPIPVSGPGQVLVRVHASSVNPGNVKRGAGRLRGIVPELEFPWVPGGDFSGVVEEVGGNVTSFRVGDAVFGSGGPGGAYAEYLTADANIIAPKPAVFTHREAASLGLVLQTAALSLDEAGLKAAQTVLILGAGGAVGNVTLQLARLRGARVLAVCRSRSVERLHSLGADEVINADTTAFETVAKNVDIVVDGLGGEFEQKAFSVLKPNGILVALTRPPSQEQAGRHRVRAFLVRTQPQPGYLAKLGKEIGDGKIKPFLGPTYPLSETAQAWKDYESGLIEGKIVISVVNEQ